MREGERKGGKWREGEERRGREEEWMTEKIGGEERKGDPVTENLMSPQCSEQDLVSPGVRDGDFLRACFPVFPRQAQSGEL